MKKALKELLDTAESRIAGEYNAFLIVDEHKPYGGFYGNTGYNFITVLGYDNTTQKYYKISANTADVMYTFDKMKWNIDIPTDLGCIRIWFDKPVYINTDISISSVRVDAENDRRW